MPFTEEWKEKFTEFPDLMKACVVNLHLSLPPSMIDLHKLKANVRLSLGNSGNMTLKFAFQHDHVKTIWL